MSAHYAYLNARVSIAASRLLTEARLTELLKQETADNLIDLAVIEHTWLIQMLTDFEILLRPLSGGARELLIYWLHKCEIANLKTIVRGKISELKGAEIRSQLMELGPFTTLPVDQLLRTEDISELLRSLENSSYGDIARQARRVFEKEHQLYSLDAAIDRHYLLGFMHRVRALESHQREPLLPLISIFMDRFNLLWLLRYRSTYQLSAAETYYLLIPTPYSLDRNRLKNLVELNTLTEILAQLPEPLQSLLATSENIFEVDQRLVSKMRQVARQTLKWRSFTLAKVFAYVLLREMEMRRLLAIVKGQRLQLKEHIIALAAENSSVLMA